MSEKTPDRVLRERSHEDVLTRHEERRAETREAGSDVGPVAKRSNEKEAEREKGYAALGRREAQTHEADDLHQTHRPLPGASGGYKLRWGASRALPGARRLGQGVEITSHEIRLVRLSCLSDEASAHRLPHVGGARHLPGERQIRVDDAVCYPLPPGVVMGTDIVDEAALSAALADCLAHQQTRLAALAQAYECDPDTVNGDKQAMSPNVNAIALALCPSVVMQQEVWLEDLMPGFRMRLPHIVDEAAFDALEPWVLLYAQKMIGIDPADIIVDWYRSAPFDPDRVTVAAAQRHYLDVRERVTGAAGTSLSALGDAAAAALGACRFVVARCLHAPMEQDRGTGLYPAPVVGPRFTPPIHGAYQAARAAMERINHRVASQRFAAVWIGENAWRAWTFDAGGACVEGVTLPQTGDAKAVVAKLRASAPGPLGLVLVAGEREWLEDAGGMRGIGEALGCPAIEFDASSCCVGPAATPQQLGPGLAVAFGLALRELQL